MNDKPRHIKNDLILQIAALHFAEKGFAGARVDEIAEQAGVNKATLYYRIGDKAAIYEEVLRITLETTLETIAANVDPTAGPEQQLRDHIKAFACCLYDYQHLAALIMRELAGGAGHMSASVVQRMRMMRDAVGEILQQGEKAGVFIPASPLLVHTQAVSTLLLFSACTPIRQKLLEMDADDNDPFIRASISEAAEMVADAILRSILISQPQQDTP